MADTAGAVDETGSTGLTESVARNNYSGEKRRRERERKKKKEQKRRERAERARLATDGQSDGDTQDGAVEDSSYLEYLNPGGPQDPRFEVAEEENDEDTTEA